MPFNGSNVVFITRPWASDIVRAFMSVTYACYNACVTLKEDLERCWIEGKGVTRLVATGVPVSEELAGGKLAEAMEKETGGIKWAVRAPERLGGAWGKTQKATIVSFKVHDYDDAAKLIKEGIMIGGKKRHVELFKEAPPRSPQA